MLSEVNFVVKMNEGGFSKKLFQLKIFDLSELNFFVSTN